MSDSPKQQQQQQPEQQPKSKRKLPPRPRIKLPMPSGQYTPRPYPHTPMSYVSSSYGQTPVPMTPISGQPTATVVYSTNKANEFFAHLKGIKNWTKSGLSVGEKSAFWLYEKVSSWSKRWFTHIFLFFVLFLYSILGAFLFMYIERTNEREVKEHISDERKEIVKQMRDLWFRPDVLNNTEMWTGKAIDMMIDYEEKLVPIFKQLKYQYDPADDTWNIWNAIIYCCTVYTTIAPPPDNEEPEEEEEEEEIEEKSPPASPTKIKSTTSMDEEEERRARMERMVEDTERMEARSRTRSPPAVSRRETASPRRQQDESAAAAPVKRERSMREDGDDKAGLRRRMGSPEGQRSRHLSPSSSADDDRLKRRSSSRHRYDDEPTLRRSPSQPTKKQIIPLSDNSLIQDVARAKRAYSHRDDYEAEDDEEERRPRRSGIRRRKASIVHTDEERDEISKSVNGGGSWFSWIPFFGARKQKVEEMIVEEDDRKKKQAAKTKLEKTKSIEVESTPESPPGRFRQLIELTSEFREFCRQNPEEVRILIELRNLCIVETIITILVCGLGGLAFRFTEGAFETFYKCGVKRVKRDFLDSLWNYSHNMKEDDWKSMARRKLMEFEEQLHEAHEAGVQTYSGQKNWTFLNACVYCLTVITTMGYGHIYPNTQTGRALTIVYAIFGIPMFLIILTDFGKMFTRGIKFLWAFVRRLYYTGSCRKMRRNAQMQEMMKGVQAVYDFATLRRPSQMTPEELVEMQRQQQQLLQQQEHQTNLTVDNNPPPESPSTPAMSTFEIDDEFNLPISVAITILVLYILVGALGFHIIETEWGFFDSFYFVFISMSTIGFGDFVPNEPLWMMLSIVYFIFGLALTSMCINVVQVMLTDQFKQASQKIGATIGFQVSEEDGSLKPSPPEPVEVAEVHNGTQKAKNVEETKEKLAPKAKLEVDEL